MTNVDIVAVLDALLVSCVACKSSMRILLLTGARVPLSIANITCMLYVAQCTSPNVPLKCTLINLVRLNYEIKAHII